MELKDCLKILVNNEKENQAPFQSPNGSIKITEKK